MSYREVIRQCLFLVCVLLGVGFFWSGWSAIENHKLSFEIVRLEQLDPSVKKLSDTWSPHRIQPDDAIKHYPTLSKIELISGQLTMICGVLWFLLAAVIQCARQRSLA